MNFHDDAIQFMQDLLIKLQQESQADKSGSTVSQESAEDVLLRLIGVLTEPKIQVDNQAAPTDQQSTKTPPATLVSNFFKVQRNTTANDLAAMNKLLKAYRSRLNRYSKTRTKIKLARTQVLIANPKNPVDPTTLLKNNPEDTRLAVAKELKDLQDSGDLTGLVNQELTTNQVLASSIDEVVGAIPSDIGGFSSQLTSLLRATGKESYSNIDKLTTFQDELTKESNSLQNEDNLLFEGQQTYSSNVKLSLLKVLDVLIFLTDRQQMQYSCSQCKFFQPGSTPACTFAGDGGTALTAAVVVPDSQGNQVSGRLTRPTNSCKEVWGLESNEYYTPSESIIESLEKLLRGN